MTSWILLLYFAGLLLFLAEFIVPGMVSGIIGSLMIVGSMALMVMAYPQYAFFGVIAQVLGVMAAVIGGMYLLPRTGFSRRLILTDSQQAETGWVSSESENALVGAEGTVYSALRPAGAILVDGKRYDAVADGAFIDKGQRIRVIEVHGSRVVVEAVDETEAE